MLSTTTLRTMGCPARLMDDATRIYLRAWEIFGHNEAGMGRAKAVLQEVLDEPARVARQGSVHDPLGELEPGILCAASRFAAHLEARPR